MKVDWYSLVLCVQSYVDSVDFFGKFYLRTNCNNVNTFLTNIGLQGFECPLATIGLMTENVSLYLHSLREKKKYFLANVICTPVFTVVLS